ncbi:hypothetical protein M951_chr254 (nucleomorph) [Lotharella oceanica]|uniref:Uncharacterized protein n=1 Tax=Lotharella oceanica TaxID=641309 RepID=A0A060DAR0_9EUKA|nr:hypothetical protein M951_chr254 [Lotharella oceanica]
MLNKEFINNIKILEYCSNKKAFLVDVIYIYHDHNKSENYNLNYTYFFVEYRLILFKIEHTEIVYGRLISDFEFGIEVKNGFILCFIPEYFFSEIFDLFVYNMKDEIIYGIVDYITRTEMKKFQIVLDYNIKKLALIKQIIIRK